MKVAKPGKVTLVMEFGRKLDKCRPVSNKTTATKQTLRTKRANEIVDVTKLIELWNVDRLQVTARSQKTKASVLIENWQRCPAR